MRLPILSINHQEAMKRNLLASLNLPTIPAVAFRLLEAISDPDSQVSTIVDVIKADPAITAKVLKAANSPYYSVGVRIESLDRAVVWIGRETITSLALCFSLAPDAFTDNRVGSYLKEYWLESITQAVSMQVLSQQEAPEIQDAAFATGLLLDISRLALLRNDPQTYVPVLERACHEQRPLEEVELDELGATHADLSAQMLRGWCLPENMAAAAEFHNLPLGELPANRNHPHFAFVGAASFAAATSSFLSGVNTAGCFNRLYGLMTDLYGFSPPSFLRYIDDVQERLRASSGLFAIDANRMPKLKVLLARAAEQSQHTKLWHRIKRKMAWRRRRGLEREARALPKRIQEIEQCYCRDSLTGFYALDYFDARLGQRLQHCGDATQTIAVVLAQIDPFNEIGDSYGRLAGDRVIGQVATTILRCSRSSDLVAYCGKNGFAILLDNPSFDELKHLAESVRARTRDTWIKCDDGQSSPTVSVGGVFASKLPSNPGPIFADQLTDAARKAVCRARDCGGDAAAVGLLDDNLRLRWVATADSSPASAAV